MYMLSGSIVALICPAAPLPRLQQRRERRPMLTQVVQELAEICFGFRQNSETVPSADLRDNQQSPLILQDRRPKRSAPGAQPEPGGILSKRGGERGERFGFEGLMRRMLDGKSIGAQHQYRLDDITLNETAYDFCQTGHAIALRGG